MFTADYNVIESLVEDRRSALHRDAPRARRSFAADGRRPAGRESRAWTSVLSARLSERIGRHTEDQVAVSCP